MFAAVDQPLLLGGYTFLLFYSLFNSLYLRAHKLCICVLYDEYVMAPHPILSLYTYEEKIKIEEKAYLVSRLNINLYLLAGQCLRMGQIQFGIIVTIENYKIIQTLFGSDGLR